MTDHGADDATGDPSDPRVDTALTALDDLDSLDLPAQLEVFTDLQAALALVLDSPESDERDLAPDVYDSTAPASVS